MLSQTTTFSLSGITAEPVRVELDIRSGLPSFQIVGLGDAAVREARERVRAALLNAGYEFPARRITANLAPADLRKAGPGFDLALAVAILAASGQIKSRGLESTALLGELSLDGSVRGCRGTLAVAEAAKQHGVTRMLVADSRAAEAGLVTGLAVAPVADLREVEQVLSGGKVRDLPRPALIDQQAIEPDLLDLRGHAAAVDALTVAAAGRHGILMVGPPGTGKTMLARRLPGLLPAPTHDEALEITRIASASNIAVSALATKRPFRAPHHSISIAGLVGGGGVPKPGEITLAHRGVLFLDELSEFPRSTLDSLRQPLEEGNILIARGRERAVFPADFQLVAASNPCPCGMLGAPGDTCRCGEVELRRHGQRLSGPLLDRIDIVVSVQRPTASELGSAPVSSTEKERGRVEAVRERRAKRSVDEAEYTPGQRLKALQQALKPDARTTLDLAYQRGTLSARGQLRVLLVARTVADLQGSGEIQREHLLQALALRSPTPVHEEVAA